MTTPTGFPLPALIQQAKAQLLADGYHAPTLLLTGSKSGLVLGIDILPDTHRQRIALMRTVGQRLGAENAIGALIDATLITEAWMGTLTNLQKTGRSPAQQKDRIEVLVLARMTTIPLHFDTVLIEMVRDQNDMLVELRDLADSASDFSTVRNPLLQAFAEGYQQARSVRVN